MNTSVTKGKLSISTVIMGSFLLIGVFPLSIVTYINGNNARLIQQSAVYDRLIAVSDRQAEQIESFGKEKLRDAEAFAQMPSTIEMVEYFIDLGGRPQDSFQYHRMRELAEKYKLIYEFHDILIISMEGNVIFSVIEEADLGTNLITGPYRDTPLAASFIRTRNQETSIISKFDYYNPSKQPAAFVAQPIYRNPTDSIAMAVVATQLTGETINQVVNNYTGLGQTGETVIASKEEGRFVFLTNLRHDPEAAFNIQGEMGAPEAISMQHALLQEAGYGISVDYRQKEVLAVWKFIPLWNWGMVVKMDEVEAFASINTYLIYMWQITVLALVGIVALAIYIARLVSQPILELVEVSAEISSGNMDVKAGNLGIVELSTLSGSFNEMTASLGEAIRNRDSEISRRVDAQEELDQNANRLISANADLQAKIERLDKSRKAMFFMIGDVNRVSKNLAAVNLELEAFSYSVSHDLRTPLRALDGFSNALLDDYADQLDAQGKDFLNRICAASQRMSTLIDDLLGLSRITRQEMKIGPVDLSQMVQTIVDELKEREPERPVEMVIEPAIKTTGDKRLLEVMLVNLLGNAWKFTAKKSSTRITFGSTRIKDRKTLFLRDNGAGFDMAYADKLFGAFQRLHANHEFEGSGIGLATVQRIINRHGGTVWAEAKVDEGATFFFTLG